MNFKDRFFAAETELGSLLIKISAICGTAVALIGEGGQYLGFIPPGFIPIWVKTTVGIIIFLGALYGKMTVKDETPK